MIFDVSDGNIFNSCYANNSALFDSRASMVIGPMFALTIDEPGDFFLHAARIIAMSTFTAV